MLRIKSETEYSEVPMMRHGDWLKQQLQWKRPYDEIVREGEALGYPGWSRVTVGDSGENDRAIAALA